MTRFSAEDLLSALLEAAARPTFQAPRDARGLYGLVDHHGDLRYIGSTSSSDQTFYERIHQRHRTGSESMSHYFSQMYNTGRMWRDRKDRLTKADGDIAKALRNEFVVDHCRAVWLPRAEWLADLRAQALRQFDALAVPGIDQRETDAIQRIVEARKFLGLAFAGYGKQGKAIYDALGLQLPEKKGKAA